MDLLEACWMIRSLEQSVASISMDDENNLVVGGWDGQIRKWNSDGDLLWSQTLPDRISEIIFHADQIITTSGLHIVNLDSKSGQVNWQHPLEGSADSTIVENEEIYVTSSVYDIEHNDFLESAIWKFSQSGEQSWVLRMDERPWFIMRHDDKVIAGLGRPLSGWGEILSEGQIINHQLDSKSPIMCGTQYSKGILFGHADGTISSLKGRKNKFPHSIESLDASDEIYIASLEGGQLVAINHSNEEIWNDKGDLINAQTIGFATSQLTTHWVTRWSGINGILEVRNANSGDIISCSKIVQSKAIFSNKSRVAIGGEDGKIYVWQNDMFERRMALENVDETNLNDKRNALKDRLRSLRNRK